MASEIITLTLALADAARPSPVGGPALPLNREDDRLACAGTIQTRGC